MNTWWWDSKYSSDRLEVDVQQINGSYTAGGLLNYGASALVQGTISTGSSTSSINTDLSGFADDTFNGRVMTLIDDPIGKQTVRINDYTSTGSPEVGVFTVSGFTNAPTNGSIFVIS